MKYRNCLRHSLNSLSATASRSSAAAATFRRLLAAIVAVSSRNTRALLSAPCKPCAAHAEALQCSDLWRRSPYPGAAPAPVPLTATNKMKKNGTRAATLVNIETNCFALTGESFHKRSLQPACHLLPSVTCKLACKCAYADMSYVCVHRVRYISSMNEHTYLNHNRLKKIQTSLKS